MLVRASVIVSFPVGEGVRNSRDPIFRSSVYGQRGKGDPDATAQPALTSGIDW